MFILSSFPCWNKTRVSSYQHRSSMEICRRVLRRLNFQNIVRNFSRFSFVSVWSELIRRQSLFKRSESMHKICDSKIAEDTVSRFAFYIAGRMFTSSGLLVRQNFWKSLHGFWEFKNSTGLIYLSTSRDDEPYLAVYFRDIRKKFCLSFAREWEIDSLWA